MILSSLKRKLHKNSKVLYGVAGIFWVALSYVSFTYLLLWPAAACFLSSALLTSIPSSRFSISLAKATALYGVAISVLQIYFSSLILGSHLFLLGLESIAIFLLVGFFHVILLFASTKESVK
jgi:hypothetical protein